jgi:N-glycosylase/DNA lyase
MNSKSKILVVKGSDYYQTIKNKPGHITLVATINAAGYSCPSLLICQDGSIPIDINFPKSIRVTANPSGWMNEATKKHWFENGWNISSSI